jgi:two-component system sensor histidine kinase KdpD
MSHPDERPDPDALLRRANAEDVRASQGKLKVFLGFAPGVGKTYRMLQVARDLVADQKLDLVVGLIEAHKRAETAAMVLGLELLPRQKVEYKGAIIEELDLDAALARRPKLILVDELAHTNAAGSRHPKRWQDVLELLEAGIDVFTTVNVQHLESLNDVVAQIVQVRVRETVPDSVLDRADEIELVDIAPEELLERLREGKVYLGEQAQRASEHFFRRGNLLALRELSLRQMAQRVDGDVLAYRAEHGVYATWPAGERILVCIGPSPSSLPLIRAAARMAAGLRCPWVAVHVAVSTRVLGAEDRERLEAHLRLAESLGASVARLSGHRVSHALLGYAQRHNVTRIVIGKPTHPRVLDRLRGSLLDEVVRGSGNIDVSVTSGATEVRGAELKPTVIAARPSPYGYGWALGFVLVTTGLALAVRATYPLPDLEILYLLAVFVVALRFGRGPAITCAALGVGAYDFFFVPPFYTFAVAEGRYMLTFAMMFLVSYTVGELTTRVRRQELDAVSREGRTSVLYALSRDLGGATTVSGIGEVVARHANDAFAVPALVVQADEGSGLQVLASAPPGRGLRSAENGVVTWCLQHGKLAGAGTDTLPGAGILCTPIRVGSGEPCVLVLDLSAGAVLFGEQRELLDALCRQAGFAFERVALAEEARAAALRAKTEELRSSLLSAVSHDLRTPLSVITGAGTALRDDDNLSEPTRRELLGSICEEADRLERLLANLLDMTRLEGEAISLAKDWVPLEEMVGSALTRLEKRLGKRAVTIAIAPDLPLPWVDPVLFEQIFVNLFENAAKYTPADSPLEVVGASEGDNLVIEVRDRGSGLPAGSEEQVFERFFRAAHGGAPGVGLGLPICRAIAEAHGGRMQAFNREGGGAVFRIVLPVASQPSLPPASQSSSQAPEAGP